MGITNVFGIAVTPHSMLIRSETPSSSRVLHDLFIGVGIYLGYAAVSLDALEHINTLRRNVLIAIVKHEAGKLFIRDEQECHSEMCIRHGVSGFQDFVARYTAPGMDFCSDCGHKLGETIERLRFAVLGDMFGSLRR